MPLLVSGVRGGTEEASVDGLPMSSPDCAAAVQSTLSLSASHCMPPLAVCPSLFATADWRTLAAQVLAVKMNVDLVVFLSQAGGAYTAGEQELLLTDY